MSFGLHHNRRLRGTGYESIKFIWSKSENAWDVYAGKNFTIDFVEHDLMGGENRKEEYLSKNPGGQLSALE